ncbi:MAG: hypothetical protein L3J20_04340 [Flavobacteriaceae bacterium]|nr:hypothetical protein [Flavobacteriaceae bacterium]
MEIEKGENSKKEIGWFLVIVMVIIGLWLGNLYVLKDIEERGTFGDMFGSINALFSGLALAGIIFTILLQRLSTE